MKERIKSLYKEAVDETNAILKKEKEFFLDLPDILPDDSKPLAVTEYYFIRWHNLYQSDPLIYENYQDEKKKAETYMRSNNNNDPIVKMKHLHLNDWNRYGDLLEVRGFVLRDDETFNEVLRNLFRVSLNKFLEKYAIDNEFNPSDINYDYDNAVDFMNNILTEEQYINRTFRIKQISQWLTTP